MALGTSTALHNQQTPKSQSISVSHPPLMQASTFLEKGCAMGVFETYYNETVQERKHK